MKRINKSSPPNELTVYADASPTENWESFRNHNGSEDYKNIRRIVLKDQGGLCGYCEKKIDSLAEHHQRIEHYHSKSDTQGSHNWALDWENIFAVCIGGNNTDPTLYPLPDNLSCDSYKDHLIGKGRLAKACEGYYLNPLQVVSTASLFTFDKATGRLGVDVDACQLLAGSQNQYETVEKLVIKTIDILNLNCYRLCDDRLKVLREWNQQISKARQVNNIHIHQQLAQRWFSKPWPSFFTTRRILLGSHAENYLKSINYNG